MIIDANCRRFSGWMAQAFPADKLFLSPFVHVLNIGYYPPLAASNQKANER
jgi:hypothetical protein